MKDSKGATLAARGMTHVAAERREPDTGGGSSPIRLRRILFFAEPATLAHVIRPVVLAGALPQERYVVGFATGRDYRRYAEQAGLEVRDLWSIGTRAYLSAVRAGRVVFPVDTLERYVREDLRHIEAFRPDVVVGDFRLSLAVSARLVKVPYVALSNAYWSPCVEARYQIPVHPATRLLGPALANALFTFLRPLILAHHSLPMHRLRRRYGMASLGWDLGAVFTEGDVTAYADLPALVRGADCGDPGRYRYIGPVLWSPAAPLPASLQAANGDRPWVYVALGSSGDAALVPTLLQALQSVECRVALATGDAVPASALPPGVVAAPMLPGDKVAALAQLVICNGGSPGTYQAFAEGTPVLGIPANLDQMLNMHFVAASGAGLALRADEVTVDRVAQMVKEMLTAPGYAAQAKRLSAGFTEYHAPARFAAILGDLTPAADAIR